MWRITTEPIYFLDTLGLGQLRRPAASGIEDSHSRQTARTWRKPPATRHCSGIRYNSTGSECGAESFLLHEINMNLGQKNQIYGHQNDTRM